MFYKRIAIYLSGYEKLFQSCDLNLRFRIIMEIYSAVFDLIVKLLTYEKENNLNGK